MSTSVIGLVSGRERDEIEYGDGHYGEKNGERDMDIAQERGRRYGDVRVVGRNGISDGVCTRVSFEQQDDNHMPTGAPAMNKRSVKICPILVT